MFSLSAMMLAPVAFADARPVSGNMVAFADAITVASNFTAIGFSITLTPVAGGTPIMYYMEPGFYNHENQWHIPEGFYNVTFTPFGSYIPTTYIGINGVGVTKYTTGSAPVSFTNVQLYPGGGNQVLISQY